MGKVKVAILKAPGTNCDGETFHAFQWAGASAEFLWFEELKIGTKRLSEYQILAIPGGFTYGDDLGAGKLLANELKFKLADTLKEFLDKERLIIGICNGFQILVKSGILPSGKPSLPQEATLTWNDSGRFEDRWVFLKPEFNICIWTFGMEELIELPVAHGEGKFIPRDENVLEHLLAYGQIVFHYCDPEGRPAGYPWNPNGSMGNIAGICDPTGRVLGMMPHPERHMAGLQHPRWRRQGLRIEGAGLRIFQNGVRWAQKHL